MGTRWVNFDYSFCTFLSASPALCTVIVPLDLSTTPGVLPNIRATIAVDSPFARS